MPAHVTRVPKHRSERPLIHFSVLGSYTIICLSELITYLYHVLCSCHIAFHVHVHVSVRFHISYHIHVSGTQLYILHFLYFSCYYYIWHFIYLYSLMPMYLHIIHVFFSLYESILLRNWNHSNWIIQTKVMAFSCETNQFTDITLGIVCNTHFSEVSTPYLTLVICIHLKLRC